MTKARGKRVRVHKRNLFAELREGMRALAEARQGKRSLILQTPSDESLSGMG